jgi:arylformamidase
LFNDGWTADKIPFERLIGKCQVLDVKNVSTITSSDLKKHTITQKIVLLKTRNSADPMKKFNPHHVDMSVDAAQYLIDEGVTTVGYDYQTFERDGKNVLHKMFLEKSITLIDNLRLKNATEKEYFLICLPIKVTGIDAAPVRAILVEEHA